MADQTLQFIITAQNNAKQAFNEAKNQLKDFEKETKDVSDTIKKMTGALAVVGAAAGAFGVSAVKVAADIETQKIGFQTLLGSVEEADAAIRMIQEDAASTPFEFAGLVEANKALTLVTKNAYQSEEVLLNVGKALAAAGKNQSELDRIIVNLQQIGNTGKITEMDIRQFGYAGVNILELLADYYGTTKEAAGEMVKKSKNAFNDLAAAFEKAGNDGGKYADAFINAGNSLNQIWSNLQDTWNIFLANEGAKLLEWAKSFIQIATKIIQETLPSWIEKIEEFTKWFGENKTAIAAAAGVITALLVPAITGYMIPAFVNAAKMIAATIKVLTVGNPWGIAIGLIVALAAAIIMNWDKISMKWNVFCAELKRIFWITIEKVAEGIDWIMNLFGQSFSALDTLKGKVAESEAAVAEWKAAAVSAMQAQELATQESNQEMGKTNDWANILKKSVTGAFDSGSESASDFAEEVKKAKDRLREMARDFEQTQTDTMQEGKDNVVNYLAKIIAENETANHKIAINESIVTDLLINQAAAKTKAEKDSINEQILDYRQQTLTLQDESAQRTATIQRYSELVNQYQAEITSQVKYYSADEVTQIQMDTEKKLLENKKEYLQKQINLLQDLLDKKKAADEEVAIATEKAGIVNSLEQETTAIVKNELSSKLSAVRNTATQMVKEWNKVASAMASALSQKASSALGLNTSKASWYSVDDAIITPQGQVITTNPADYLIATKNPAGLGGQGLALTVNINGGYYLDRDAADEIGEKIIQKLKQTMKL